MTRKAVLPSLVLLLATLPASAQLLRIYYPDIEQGSSTLVVSPTGQALLIDAGTGIKSTEDAIEEFINDLIDAGVVTSLDYTIASHYDEDHIGRMENVFQMVPMDPAAIAYDRGEFHSTPSTFAYSDYAFGAGQHNRTSVPKCTTLSLGGGVTAKVYTVNGEVCGGSTIDVTGSGQFENSASVTVVVEYGDVDVWIGGDLTGNPAKGVTDVESEAAPQVGDADVYTFNHHGSETSTNQTFLSALKAEVGLNQNSASNSFGHPRAVIVSRFLATPDTNSATPIFYQQNPGNSGDPDSDDSLADAIADCDDTTGAFGLPGTMTLLSDGTSYRIHACGIPATEFAADEGLGTIGDYPPAIRRVLRTPQVPLASETVTVEADIDDLSSAEIQYDLDDVAQTPIAMTLVSGNTYSGTIPAQTDGTKVKLRVAATDSAAQTEVSAAQGYYSGTTDISTVRVNDADGVLVPKAYGVRVEGNLTVEPGIFHTFVSQIWVQDATGGIQVFDPAFLSLNRGDLVELRGVMEQFGGATEISTASGFGNVGHTFISAGSAPAPQVVTVAGANEAVEGTLIRINGVTVTDGTIAATGNSSLTITDDGGTSTMTLRIDGDTDIPGSNTPTQPFDVIGVASQFDSWVPLTSGFQISPREQADILSDEVNHPDVVISEIHADPANGGNGDANGDGTRSATQDEFVELLNTSYDPVDISGWTISDGVGLKHTFPASTVIPGREAAVVFGGGTPTGDFGNAAMGGLVFTASTGGLGLNNTGDTVTLGDGVGTVQAVTYGSEGNSNQSLVRDPDFSNAPFVKHQDATGSNNARYSPGTRINGQAFTVPPGAILLTEVMYDPTGADGQLEWLELYNTTSGSIDVGDLCVGSGGGDYTNSTVQLSGTIAAGATYVVGGPTSSADNANPTLDLVYDFSPDFQNSGADADGVALFNLQCALVTASTVPVDAVVYGAANTNGLIDETGSANAPEVGDASSGQTIERVDNAGVWHIQPVPTPNAYTDGGPPGPPEGLLLSEVLYDVPSGDDGFEWIELYHSGTETIDLAQFSLGWGGTTYSNSAQLSGTIVPGEVFVVGGPSSDASNANPTYDLVLNFSSDLQNSGSPGDGIALYNLPEASVTGSTVPIDAVIYGPNNNSGLIDETGSANPPEVGDAPESQSIERTDLAGSWQIQSSPTPNTSPLTGGGGTPTSMHVDSIVLSTVNAGQGKKRGRAVVTIVDDLGSPVSGVDVTGTFTGDFSETPPAETTNASGVATIDTSGTKKGSISFTFCVDSVTGGSLTYDSGANVETCDTL